MRNLVSHPEEEIRLRVFENRLLMIYGPTRDELTGERELYDLYVSPNTTGVITSTGTRWPGCVSTPSIDGRIY